MLNYEKTVFFTVRERDLVQQRNLKKAFDELWSDLNKPSVTVDRVLIILISEKNIITCIQHSHAHCDFCLGVCYDIWPLHSESFYSMIRRTSHTLKVVISSRYHLLPMYSISQNKWRYCRCNYQLSNDLCRSLRADEIYKSIQMYWHDWIILL